MKSLRLLTLPLLLAASAHAADLGNLVFIGDSITQGGNGNPSYRYQVWKALVDNDVDFTFVGSQTGAYNYNSVTAPAYLAKTFTNVHEGHWGWRASWEAGSVALINGREHTANLGHGTLRNWLGLASTYTNYAGVQTYTGTTYTPDTAVILIGVNDIGSGSGGALRSSAQVVADINAMVTQLQTANPAVRVYVSSVLPSSNVTGGVEVKRVEINNALESGAAGWSTATSTVSFINTGEGFTPSTMTYDATHPNQRGEIHVGNKIAAALGFARTLGLPAVHADDLVFQSDFSTLPGTAASSVAFYRVGGGSFTLVPATESLELNSGRRDSHIRTNWGLASNAPYTVETKLRVLNTGDSLNNVVIWADDGAGGSPAAFLRIYPDRVSWGHSSPTVLLTGDNTDTEHTFRVVYNGSSFAVWRDNVLVGEGLGASGVGANQNWLLVGNYSGSQSAAAVINYVNYEKGSAFGPAITPLVTP